MFLLKDPLPRVKHSTTEPLRSHARARVCVLLLIVGKPITLGGGGGGLDPCPPLDPHMIQLKYRSLWHFVWVFTFCQSTRLHVSSIKKSNA